MERYQLKINAVKPTQQSVNHIFAVDVSGSMYDALPKMRQHIKNKLAFLVKPKDTVSIIYFSSKNQCGVVFEGATINDATDLTQLHKAVDKFLQTIGLTGFVEPIEEAIEVAKRMSKMSVNGHLNDNVNSFIFMTDGYDNQWSKAEIIKKAALLPQYFDSISFLEYGWYCNRPLIAEMAEVSGGAHVFSENYNGYEPIVERLFQNKTVKRKKVPVDADTAFYLDNEEVILVEARDGVVYIPEDIDTLYFIGEDEDYKKQLSTIPDTTKYVALYVAIHKMKTDMAWSLLKSLGDVRLIKLFANCFSKQEYTLMKEAVRECVFHEDKRFSEGVDHNLVPKEDAYTALDALNDLMAGENFLQTNDTSFNYQRIGTAGSTKDIGADKIAELQEQMANTKDLAEIKELANQIAQVESWVPKFKEAPSEKGEPILNLVSNESRPNVSIQITKQGFVAIPEDKVKSLGLPAEVPTQIYRNYTIIKDGILNMKTLPATLDAKTFEKLKMEGLVSGEYSDHQVYQVDLSKAPLINRNMVKKVSAKDFFTRHLELQALKAKQKVFKFYMDEVAPKKQDKLLEAYGTEATQWLETIGIKDYGFSPKVEKEKSGDFYYSKELNVKLAGLSSLPSMKALTDKIAKKSKLNLADTLMVKAIDEYKAFVELPAIQNSSAKNELIEKWLTTETKTIIQNVRKIQHELNKTLYSIVVGQAWFEEFKSLDDNELTVAFEGQEVVCKAVLGEKEIPI